MAFAQLTYRESLRDIETCLRALGSKLYHCGFRGKMTRNTLANANEKRDWRIYQDFAQLLIARARRLYIDEDFGGMLKNTVYALDSTTIDLCNTIQFYKEQRVLCHTGKKQSGLYPPELSHHQQKYRTPQRPNNQTDRTEEFKAVSRTTETNRISRHRTQQTLCVSNQQLYVGCVDNYRTVQVPMADRTVFQMDQTTPANQIILRHFHQRRQDPDMDRNQYICACSNYQKRVENSAKSCRNPANSQHSPFRENLAISSTYDKLFTKQRASKL